MDGTAAAATVAVTDGAPAGLAEELRRAGFDVTERPLEAGPGVVVGAPGSWPEELPHGVVAVAVIEDPGAADLGGAHDLLRVPVVPAELVARVRAAARYAVLSAEAARTDPLTGLSNRRHLDEHLDMVSSGARRLRAPASLLLVDVDHLARVNDADGDVAGDAVLQAVGSRIARRLRGEDLVGRWSDDDFLVILPHTPLDGGWQLAERIRRSVSDEPVKLEAGGEVLVTVSIGCAQGDGDDLDDHLARATAALAEAKAAGRNRVVADPTSSL